MITVTLVVCWYDEAVYANAKLIKEDYKEDTSDIAEIKTVDTYDQQLKQNDLQEITGDYELTLLQKTVCKKCRIRNF